MPGDSKANDTAPLIRVAATAVVIALVVTLVAIVVTVGPFETPAEGPTAPAPLEALAALSVPPPEAAFGPPKPIPMWIWSSQNAAPNQRAFFRRTLWFDEPPKRATLWLSCDNEALIYVGQRRVGRSAHWEEPVELDLTPFLSAGAAELTIHARNREGPAGLMARIEIERSAGDKEYLVTNAQWSVSETPDFESTRLATEIGRYGTAPWGQLAGFYSGGIERNISAAPGFAVELVYAVPRRQGSWVSLAVDGRGRLITSSESGGLYRVTPPPLGQDATKTTVESIESSVGAAHGLLCLDNELYCVVAGNRASGPGLYRLRDTDGDDRYDESKLLRSMADGGEHGPHGIVLGPDGLLYVVGGNHTPLPDPERSTVPRRWGEDHLLPRLWDAGGHAVGITAPGGWVCRTDRDGEIWEIVATGFRNPYDLAFNADGELFAYDADMEWDLGAPWYRPTRVNHVVSGAEFGWRSGTAKWPTHYPDSLPAVLDIGPGSPTGVTFGYGSRFPARYQRALYLLDWTYATIYAIHLEPDGASYRATRETFLTGRPLPLTDVVINSGDGAMYFTVGGRGVPSALYRVRYEGKGSIEPQPPVARSGDTERTIRRRLETFHHPDAAASAIEEIWPHLGNPDRFIRFAARVALEHQPLGRWIDLVWAEEDSRAKLAALLALIRCGSAEHEARVVEALRSIDWPELDRAHQLEFLRCWALCFIRLGEPDAKTAGSLARSFKAAYPTGDDRLDRELCDLLVYLNSSVVVARTIPLMERVDAAAAPAVDPALLSRSDTYGSVILKMAAASPQRSQVHYALSLRNASRGWTPQLRERYFRWFEAARRTRGGLSFAGFLQNIRKDALAKVPPSLRARYATIGAAAASMDLDLPRPRGPGRAWTVEELVDLAREGLTNRDFENGRRTYAAASCIRCHRFAGTGRWGGPDLTSVASRYSVRDLAEACVEPSRTIPDPYVQSELLLDDDTLVLGRIIDHDGRRVRVMPTYLAPDSTIDIPIERIREQRPSAVSPMMPGLLNPLGPEEVLDLLAYLLAEGDPRSPMFRQGDEPR